MITEAFIFLATAIVITGFYLYQFKEAEIQISFIKGIMIGTSLESPELDRVKTNYLDIYLGIVIVSFIWDTEC